MMADITIALATDADIADVAPLLGVQLDEHGMGMSKGALVAALRGIVVHPDRGRVLVARRGAEAVGFAVMPFTWTVEHGGHCAWLDELYVVPDLRDHGLGTALLLEAMNVVRAAGCIAMDLEVDADHARVESLYLRHGFRALSRKRFSRRL
jgi:GNAT superfamily N-acetyltransferase